MIAVAETSLPSQRRAPGEYFWAVNSAATTPVRSPSTFTSPAELARRRVYPLTTYAEERQPSVPTQAPASYLEGMDAQRVGMDFLEAFIKMESRGIFVATVSLGEIEPLRASAATNITEKTKKDLHEIKTLVESGRVREARRYLLDLRMSMEVRPEIAAWSQVLAEPVVVSEHDATGGDLGNNTTWLKQHTSEYQGRWVALKQGVLLGSHKSRVELHRHLKNAGKLSGAMFVRIG